MTTVVSTAQPVWRFADNNNNPLVGGLLYSYQGGSTTPLATYTDSTGSVQNTNPIVLNARGETANANGTSVGVWIPNGTSYKFILTDSSGNTIWTVDQVFGPLVNFNSLTGSIVGQALYPQTAAEIAAGVTPTNYQYPVGNVLRYGAVGNGVNNDTGAIQAAINTIVTAGGGTVTLIAGATHAISGLVILGSNVTFDFNGAVLYQITGTANTPMITIGNNTNSYSDISILKANFNGNSSNVSGNLASGIVAYLVTNLNVDRIDAQYIRRFACSINGCTNVNIGEINFTNGGVSSASAQGISFSGYLSKNIVVGSINCSSMYGVGVFAQSCSNLTINNFQASNITLDDGISLLLCQNITINSYNCNYVANAAIELESCSDFYIGPGFVQNSGYGIFIGPTNGSGSSETPSTNGVIVSPNTQGNANYGLRIIGGQYISIFEPRINESAIITNSSFSTPTVASDIKIYGGSINTFTANSGTRLKAFNTNFLSSIPTNNSADFSYVVNPGFYGLIASGNSVNISMNGLNTYAGILHVVSWFTGSFNQNTSALYHINQLGTTTVTSVSTSSGSVARQVTVTSPSSSQITLANSTGVNCYVSAEWLGTII